VQVPQRAQRLYSIWSRLPDAPLTEREFEEAILKLLDGPAREADATAFMSTLRHAEAMIASQGEDGVLRFHKAPEFPTWDHDVGPGSASWDEHLRELAERERVQYDAAGEEAWQASPQRRQREETATFVRSVVNEVIDERINELRAQLPMLVRRHIDAQTVRARVERALDQTQAAQAVRDTTRPDQPAGREGSR
jgi:hypothetical protein